MNRRLYRPKPDINDLMKPLSQKANNFRNVWGAVINVQKDAETGPPPTPSITPSNTPTGTPVPTTTPSGTPAVTPTPSATPPAQLLFNLYSTNAFAGYSLRLLDSTYTGDSIRVRRELDNTEQDIGFDINGVLDTAALSSFCNSTTGWVVKMYDQSGNGYDMVQSTAIQQFQIFDGSSVITNPENGLPAMLAVNKAQDENANYYIADLGLNNIADADVAAYVTNYRTGTTQSLQTLWMAGDPTQGGGSGNQGIPALQAEVLSETDLGCHNTFVSYVGSVVVDQSPSATTKTWISSYNRDYTTITITSRAGDASLSNSGTQTWSSSPQGYNKMSIGVQSTSGGWGGSVGGWYQECVVWSQSQTTNHTGITNNINDYYGVY